jgi:hypothetical protein
MAALVILHMSLPILPRHICGNLRYGYKEDLTRVMNKWPYFHQASYTCAVFNSRLKSSTLTYTTESCVFVAFPYTNRFLVAKYALPFSYFLHQTGIKRLYDLLCGEGTILASLLPQPPLRLAATSKVVDLTRKRGTAHPIRRGYYQFWIDKRGIRHSS